VLINKGSTFIYGDRAEYDGEKNEAKIYSDIIKVVDGTTTMYTYNFTFNTKSNVGTYTGGGVVIDEKNRLESDRGYYNADTKDIICVERVEMRDEKYQMKGDSVIYNMDTNNARFFRNTNIWNQEDNEYLYADCGEFRDAEDLYRLTENGYILTEEQELWSDSLDYYRERGYALLRNNIQIDDSKNKLLVFGDWGEYWKEPGNAFLTQNPALVSYDTEQGDSLFIRSDSMYLFTKDPVAERLERERIAKHRADSIALADSLAQIAKEAEAAKAAAKTAVKSEEHGEIEVEKPTTPMTNEQRREQALAALEAGERSWFDDAETRLIEAHNQGFSTRRGVWDLLRQHFEPCEAPKSAEERQAMLWAANHVYDYLREKSPSAMEGIERTTFGWYLKEIGAHQVRVDNRRLWAVRKVG
jgi:lipopolysaccharide export system protein LptA